MDCVSAYLREGEIRALNALTTLKMLQPDKVEAYAHPSSDCTPPCQPEGVGTGTGRLTTPSSPPGWQGRVRAG